MQNSKDSLGDLHKVYESQFTGLKCLPHMPVLARLDGRAFHSFTKGLPRPFDNRLHESFIFATKKLIEESGADIGYTQSDEITLCWSNQELKSEIYFNGKIFKMISALSVIGSQALNQAINDNIPERYQSNVMLDCRIWQVPNLDIAATNFLWREMDATRNSVSMAASTVCSHKELQNMSRTERMDALMDHGINWNDYPAEFKRGTYVRKEKVLRKFTNTEIEKLPPKHEARSNPNLQVSRTEIFEIHPPPLSKITNKVDFLFGNKEPERIK